MADLETALVDFLLESPAQLAVIAILALVVLSRFSDMLGSDLWSGDGDPCDGGGGDGD